MMVRISLIHQMEIVVKLLPLHQSMGFTIHICFYLNPFLAHLLLRKVSWLHNKFHSYNKFHRYLWIRLTCVVLFLFCRLLKSQSKKLTELLSIKITNEFKHAVQWTVTGRVDFVLGSRQDFRAPKHWPSQRISQKTSTWNWQKTRRT